MAQKSSSGTHERSKPAKAAPLRPLASLPVPIFPLRPVFSRLIKALASRHDGLFERLGTYGSKHFLIDPVDMPVVLRLIPDAAKPELEPFARKDSPECDATISGPFLNLIRLVSGKEDGDALFFSRELVIKGDTEAVLALRNAIDDMDIDLFEEIEDLLGPLGKPLAFARHKAALATEQLTRAHHAFLSPAFERSDRIERELSEMKRSASRPRPARKKSSSPAPSENSGDAGS